MVLNVENPATFPQPGVLDAPVRRNYPAMSLCARKPASTVTVNSTSKLVTSCLP